MTQVQNSLTNNICINSYKHKSEEMATDHLGSPYHIPNKFTNRKQQFLFLKDSVQMNQCHSSAKDQCSICAHCLESVPLLSPLSSVTVVSGHTDLKSKWHSAKDSCTICAHCLESKCRSSA